MRIPLENLVAELGMDLATLEQQVIPRGSNVAQALRATIESSDLVIALVDRSARANVLIELGMAIGMGKQAVVVQKRDASLDFDLAGVLSVKLLASDLDPVRLALRAVPRPANIVVISAEENRNLPALSTVKVADLLRAVREANTELEVQGVLREAFDLATERYSVGSALSTGGRAMRPDFGVWSSGLDSIGANPLLVEVKRVRSRADFANGVSQLHNYLDAVRVGGGLLLYFGSQDATVRDDAVSRAAGVLVAHVEEFISDLGRNDFDHTIRRLRNRLVHGQI